LMIRGALVATAAGQYRDFAQLGAASAKAVDATAFTDEAIGELAATLRSLPAHPDVPGALAALREQGHRLVALANSPQRVVDAQLDHAGLSPLLDAVYSAEHAGHIGV